ncbi:glycoside hydrolase family 13 protein [Sungkyunkwania multivorans]|uniref:Glycoside hydrolase family 13 protein n=1 Tax=Sungkyunkwania multivorans TaxID=1173618 RepID=A0ABW3D362_9FLAO
MKPIYQIGFYILLLFGSLGCKQKDSTSTSTVDTNPVSNQKVERVEPPNWWIGFHNTHLQLLVKEPNIGEATVKIIYPGVTIKKVHSAHSPNYLFLDLHIAPETEAGVFDIVFTYPSGTEKKHTYELKARLKKPEDYVGFDSSDAVYLITPDRFANAETSNDVVAGLKEATIDRSKDYARHGGDIAGIIAHLDYISDMGFTAIWPSPLLTNDMPQWSYHGYAMTDFYEVDPRFGSLEDYKRLADETRKKGIKLIMDQVANHCGLEHWWMKDLPFKNWVNYQKDFENKEPTTFSNHRRTANQDSYASVADKEGMANGWFVSSMPDLNQRNPFMGNYLVQNSIWWIETLGLGGIRQDTYPYPDKQFMSEWAGAIMEEYPNFSIVGEEWSYNPLLIGYWQEGANNRDGYDSNLTSTMDFAMQQAVADALKEPENWNTGLVKIYEGLANDFYYASPKDIMVFPDNHDMDRVFTRLNEDVPNTKMALATFLTLPRIPQIYYGTEVLMENTDKPGDHGLIRTDFPGGWEEDEVNAFTGQGLSVAQKDMQRFLKKFLNYRKDSRAIHDGKTVHFGPFMGTYFLFRIMDDETVVLILNKNETPITIDLKRYAEIGLAGKKLKNIVTNETIYWGDDIQLAEKGPLVLTTKFQ